MPFGGCNIMFLSTGVVNGSKIALRHWCMKSIARSRCWKRIWLIRKGWSELRVLPMI